MADGVLKADDVAEAALEGLRDETFLILPHSQVREYFQRKAADYDRWLSGMRRFRRSLVPSDAVMELGSDEAE